MNVGEAMTRPVRTITIDSTLASAAGVLWSADCGALPVVNPAGAVVAMLTDRDICMHAWSKGLPLSELKVAGAMSKDLVACRPGDTIEEAERLMQQHQIRRLPVIDAHGLPVGILSLSDLSFETHAARGGDGLEPMDLLHTLAAVSRPHSDTSSSALSGTA